MCHDISNAWQAALRRLRDPYRPEQHYMRGPGPKFREKELVTRSTASSADRASHFDR
jgi:hypothetical protein